MSFEIILVWTIFYGLVSWIFIIFVLYIFAKISKKQWLEPDRVLRKSVKLFKKFFIWNYRKIIKTPEEKEEKEIKKREEKLEELLGEEWEEWKLSQTQKRIKEKIQGEFLENLKRAKILAEAREAKKKRDITRALNVRLNDIGKISVEYPDIAREKIKQFVEKNPRFIEFLEGFNTVRSEESEIENIEDSTLEPEIGKTVETELTTLTSKILDIFNQNEGNFVLTMKVLENHKDFLKLFKTIRSLNSYRIEATDRFSTQEKVKKVLDSIRPEEQKEEQRDELSEKLKQEETLKRTPIINLGRKLKCIQVITKHRYVEDVPEEDIRYSIRYSDRLTKKDSIEVLIEVWDTLIETGYHSEELLKILKDKWKELYDKLKS